MKSHNNDCYKTRNLFENHHHYPKTTQGNSKSIEKRPDEDLYLFNFH